MRNLTLLLSAILCLSMPAWLMAQERDDSRYLAGAVPEVDGKVIFTKEFNIPGMSQDEIFTRIQKWMDIRLKANENNSRIVYTDKEKGQIVGTGEEWIVFSSSALSLDRTRVIYQLTAICQPEKCVFKVEKIRYVYREGKEKYTAEEWIVDKYALNKDQTKLVRGLAKWRRRTVDFVDDLTKGVIEALSATPESIQAKKEEKKAASATPAESNAPITITQKNQVEEIKPQIPPVVGVTIPSTIKVEIPAEQLVEKPVDSPADLPADLIQTGAGKLVIVIGEEPFNMTMMTANAGGSLGKVNGKQVVFTILSPDQAYEAMEKAESYIVRFYPNGKNEPSVELQCKKMPAPAAVEGMPRTYVGEIIKATVK